ncbi:hypothetical protein EON80_02030 [bacterium]|nr:MAG: hypothetical protein EON80_02030 [bacterium]
MSHPKNQRVQSGLKRDLASVLKTNMSRDLESDRHVEDSSLQLKYFLYGHAPVQAIGTLMGKHLYFRSRHEEWTFAVADSEDEAVDISFPDQGFLREGQYGKPRSSAASYMPYDEAEAIIKRCAQEYLETMA